MALSWQQSLQYAGYLSAGNVCIAVHLFGRSKVFNVMSKFNALLWMSIILINHFYFADLIYHGKRRKGNQGRRSVPYALVLEYPSTIRTDRGLVGVGGRPRVQNQILPQWSMAYAQWKYCQLFRKLRWLILLWECHSCSTSWAENQERRHHQKIPYVMSSVYIKVEAGPHQIVKGAWWVMGRIRCRQSWDDVRTCPNHCWPWLSCPQLWA